MLDGLFGLLLRLTYPRKGDLIPRDDYPEPVHKCNEFCCCGRNG